MGVIFSADFSGLRIVGNIGMVLKAQLNNPCHIDLVVSRHFISKASHYNFNVSSEQHSAAFHVYYGYTNLLCAAPEGKFVTVTSCVTLVNKSFRPHNQPYYLHGPPLNA